MGMEIFLRQEKFFGVYNEYITKSTRYTKCYARNSNHQNLYNPVTFFLFFQKLFGFSKKKSTVLYCAFVQCANCYLLL